MQTNVIKRVFNFERVQSENGRTTYHSLATAMKLYGYIILSIINLSFCKQCRLGTRTPEMETEKNLEHHLLKCYADILKPPIKDSKVVVKMDYLLQSFQFDLSEEILTLYSWNYFDWQDDRLTWKQEDYKGIKWTQVSSFDIWSPGLKLVNTADEDDFDFFYTKCKLNSTGHVRCVLRTEHKVFCTSDLTNWPYDTKSCMLQFDQWRPQETKVLFNLTHIKFVMDAFQNNGWLIAREHVFKNLKTGIQSAVKFDFERMAESLEAIIVAPSFVLAVLTVTSLLIDYRDVNRLGILCLSIISHFVFSNEMSEDIPKHSAKTPVIFLFISGSIVLTIICFLLSFCFRYLGRIKSQPPTWIASYNDFVLDDYGRYFVFTKWEVDDKDLKDVKPNVEWVNFISIVNSLWLIVVVVTYVCLLWAYIPRKPVFTFVFDIA